ncbi:MAG: hypothetical protein ACKOXB_10385 [Flavobacteriales bacterium]
MKYLLLLCSIALLSFQGDNNTELKHDGFYVGKSGKDFHHIFFNTDGTAATYIFPAQDITKAQLAMKGESDFAGPYIVHSGNIVYRSNNSINKKVQPTNPLFYTYQGKMNSKGQLVFWLTATDGSKNEITFDYFSFPK